MISKRLALFFPLVMALCACRESSPEALLERHYQPDTEYTTTMSLKSTRSLHLALPDSSVRAIMPESSMETATRQILRVGSLDNGFCPVELEVPSYTVSQPNERLRMHLAGCVGLGRYNVAARRMEWGGLKDSLWQAPALVDSAWNVQALGAPDAASYLQSTLDLLNAALADSSRRLLPGQAWSEEGRQETVIGPWPVAWKEIRTVTLRAVAGTEAIFDVAVKLVPEALPNGPAIRMEGQGKGRMDFDLARHLTTANLMDTEMTIEVPDSTATWIARSSSHLDIRSETRALPAGK
jgi:hypothetical protein